MELYLNRNFFWLSDMIAMSCRQLVIIIQFSGYARQFLIRWVLVPNEGGGGVLPYIRFIGMCDAKGYGF